MNSIGDWFTALTAGEQLNVLAFVGAAVAFTFGLWQYRDGQRWRRMEWIAKEMDAFFGDASVIAAQRMIDWGMRPIELHPTRKTEAERTVIVHDADVTRALQHHLRRPDGFDDDEAAIRDIFDRYLDRLERINSFVEARLLSVKDVRPYLRYWARHIIAAEPEDKTVKRIVQLRRFIRDYDYEGVQALLSKVARQQWPHDSAEDPDPPSGGTIAVS